MLFLQIRDRMFQWNKQRKMLIITIELYNRAKKLGDTFKMKYEAARAELHVGIMADIYPVLTKLFLLVHAKKAGDIFIYYTKIRNAG